MADSEVDALKRKVAGLEEHVAILALVVKHLSKSSPVSDVVEMHLDRIVDGFVKSDDLRVLSEKASAAMAKLKRGGE